MKWLKRKIANWLLRNLFKAVTENDVLRYEPKERTFYTGKIELSKKQAQELISGARKMQESPAWRILRKNMEYAANERMFIKGTNDDDLFFGKAMLYVIDVLYTKVYNISKIKVDKKKIK